MAAFDAFSLVGFFPDFRVGFVTAQTEGSEREERAFCPTNGFFVVVVGFVVVVVVLSVFGVAFGVGRSKVASSSSSSSSSFVSFSVGRSVVVVGDSTRDRLKKRSRPLRYSINWIPRVGRSDGRRSSFVVVVGRRRSFFVHGRRL